MAATSAKSLCRWLGYFALEPWREEAAGRRIGRLAQVTAEVSGVAEEDFDTAALTRREAKEREEHEAAKERFRSWQCS